MNYRLATNKSRFSLEKHEIIRREDDISRIFNNGKRIYLPGVTIYLRPAEKIRVCFLIKKDTGNAVARNRYKRWLREIFRKNKDLFEGHEIMFYVNRKVLIPDAGYLHYEREIKKYFSKKANE